MGFIKPLCLFYICRNVFAYSIRPRVAPQLQQTSTVPAFRRIEKSSLSLCGRNAHGHRPYRSQFYAHLIVLFLCLEALEGGNGAGK